MEPRAPLGDNTHETPRSQIAAENRQRGNSSTRRSAYRTPPPGSQVLTNEDVSESARHNNRSQSSASTRLASNRRQNLLDSANVNPTVLKDVHNNLQTTAVNAGRRAGPRRDDLLSCLDKRCNEQHAAFVKTITNTVFSVMHCTPENFKKARSNLCAAKERFEDTNGDSDKQCVEFYKNYLKKLSNHLRNE